MIWLILVVGFILRIISINQSFWLDEAISALAAKNYSYLGIINQFSLGDTHPPLYYLLLKGWADIFGFSEISLRSLSVVFGVATIFIVYLIGKEIAGKKLGLVSAALMATAPLHIYYSQEVRMYSLSTFLVVLAILAYFFISGKNPRLKNWILFSLSLFFIGLTDYLPLFILPVFFVYSFIQKKDKLWWRKFFISFIPLLIFLIFWFPVFREQTLGSKAYLSVFPAWGKLLGTASFKEIALVWIKFIIGRISFSPKILYFLIVAVVSPFYIYSFALAPKIKQHLILWLWLFLPFAMVSFGALFIPGFSYFRLIFILPALYILAAAGIVRTRFKKSFIILVVLFNLIFSVIYISNQRFWREDWRSAVAFVEGKIQPKEIVLLSFPEPFAGYKWYQRKDVAYGTQTPFENAIKGKGGVYTFDYLMDVTDPGRELFKRLAADKFKEIEVYNFRGIGQVRYWKKR